MKQYFTQNAFGRVILHSACLCKGGHFRFHLGGIRRGLRDLTRRQHAPCRCCSKTPPNS